MSTRDMDEAPWLAAALQGDHDAFRHLTEPYRRELLVYGYRLLGSFQDAEDLIQETLLRAWTRLSSFAGRSTFRAWLYKIATNTGLNMLAYTSRRSLPMNSASSVSARSGEGGPNADPSWLEPILDTALVDVSTTPDAVYSLRESVSLAFMVALHSLPPRQRAVLILRDVLDWHASEVAEFLDMSVPAVNSALQRARATLAREYHPVGLEAVKAPALNPALESLLGRYMRAWAANDVEALMALIKEDAAFAMPPLPAWYQGRYAIGQFFRSGVFMVEGAAAVWRLEPTAANAQPACVLYRFDHASSMYQYFGLVVLTIDGNSIASFTAFIDTSLGQRFSLPLALPSIVGDP